MNHAWINEEKKYGFYLVGFFDKGRVSRFNIQKEKPFEIDNIEGTVTSKCMRGFKENRWGTDWCFFEGCRISEANKDNNLRNWINEVWKEWCTKHKRKYSPILAQIQTKELK